MNKISSKFQFNSKDFEFSEPKISINKSKIKNINDKTKLIPLSIIIKAIKRFKTELLSDFLNQAISTNTGGTLDTGNSEVISEIESGIAEASNEIITTLEEIECFGIIKTLLVDTIDLSRISYKDTLSYFGILIDNNTRKWICRIYLKESSKYIVVAGENKDRTRYDIENIQDIINFKDKLIEATSMHV